MPDVVVILQTQRVPADPRTKFGKWDVQVTYKKGETLVRTVTIPEEQFNDKTQSAAIRADLDAYNISAGRTITV